jgi:hypothetical protein
MGPPNLKRSDRKWTGPLRHHPPRPPAPGRTGKLASRVELGYLAPGLARQYQDR